MIKTIQQYALEKGTSQQNVRQSKTLPLVDLEVFVEHQGERKIIGKQKFIIDNEVVKK